MCHGYSNMTIILAPVLAGIGTGGNNVYCMPKVHT